MLVANALPARHAKLRQTRERNEEDTTTSKGQQKATVAVFGPDGSGSLCGRELYMVTTIISTYNLQGVPVRARECGS